MRHTFTHLLTAVRHGWTLFFLLLAILGLMLPSHASLMPDGQGYFQAAYTGRVAWSPDGALQAVAEGFGTIALYHADDGTLARRIFAHTGSITDVAISPNGVYVASSSTDGSAKIWRISDGTLVRTITYDISISNNANDYISHIVFTPDSLSLVTADATFLTHVFIWRISDGAQSAYCGGTLNAIYALAVSPDGNYVAFSSGDKLTYLWRKVGNATTFNETNDTHTVTFSNDSTLVASGVGANVLMRKTSDGSLVRTLNVGATQQIAFTPNDQYLVVDTGSTYEFYRTSDYTLVKTINCRMTVAGIMEYIYPDTFAISPDSTQILGVDAPSTIAVWRISDSSILRYTQCPYSRYAGFSPDGQVLMNGDNFPQLLHAYDGSVLQQLLDAHYHYRARVYSADGELAAIYGNNASIYIVRVKDGTLVNTLTLNFSPTTTVLYAVSFSPDKQSLLFGYNGDLQIWRISDSTLQRTLTGIFTIGSIAAYSRDGSMIAVAKTATPSDQVNIYRRSDGTLLKAIQVGSNMAYPLIFSADGTTLISGGTSHLIKCWRVSDGVLLHTLTGHTGAVNCFALSPDGQLLASGGIDHNIILWRLSDSTPVRTLSLHKDYLQSLSFSPTGQALYSASYDGYAVWVLQRLQPDLQIKAPGDSTYQGINVYNNLDGQTLTQISRAGKTLTYQVLLNNVGLDTEAFTLTGDKSGTDFSVRYFDAQTGGNDITEQVTDAGWSTRQLTNNETQALRIEITLGAGITPGDSRAVVLTATSSINNVITDAVKAVAATVPLTSVALATNPVAPQPINTPILLTAMPTGGSNPEYKFRAGYQDAGGWHWSDLTNYQTTATCAWLPDTARLYSLLVYAREVGSTKTYDVPGTGSYRIATTLSTVSIGVTPHTPQVLGTPITLTASPTGGANLVYLYKAGYQDAAGWHWSIIRDYASASSYTWTATVPHLYRVLVYAREAESTLAYQKYSSLDYRISAPPITDATLTVSPTAPQSINTPVTLTAGSTGGYAVEYKFKAGYNDATGWHWTDITNYQAATTCAWTPTVGRSYTLLVYAREVGSTISYQKYATVVYQVTK